MGMETPKTAKPETEQKRSEQLQKAALEIGHRISWKWKEIQKLYKSNPKGLNDPRLNEIVEMTSPPKSGIQVWFESQIEWGKQQGIKDDWTMHHILEDLQELEQKFNKALEK
jgi:hypothetical protein